MPCAVSYPARRQDAGTPWPCCGATVRCGAVPCCGAAVCCGAVAAVRKVRSPSYSVTWWDGDGDGSAFQASPDPALSASAWRHGPLPGPASPGVAPLPSLYLSPMKSRCHGLLGFFPYSVLRHPRPPSALCNARARLRPGAMRQAHGRKPTLLNTKHLNHAYTLYITRV